MTLATLIGGAANAYVRGTDAGNYTAERVPFADGNGPRIRDRIMALKDDLCAVAPRERAGADSSDRFTYQMHWALLHLLVLHDTEDDYLITFDFHDDVLVLDSEANPTRVSFYQIKTRTGSHWNLGDLLARDRGKQGLLLSILGKLYDNRLRFPAHTASLNLVSNLPYRIGLRKDCGKSQSKDVISCTEFDDEVKRRVAAQLKDEHRLDEDPEFDQVMYLKVADLSLRGHRVHAEGKIHDYLVKWKGERAYHLRAIYRAIFDEILRRNNSKDPVVSFEELAARKSIGRREFQRIIDRVCVSDDPEEAWKEISSRLHREKLNPFAIRRMRRYWERFEVDRIDPSNLYLDQVCDAIRRLITEAEKDGSILTYAELMDWVVGRFQRSLWNHLPYDDDYLRVITLAMFHERVEPPATDSE